MTPRSPARAREHVCGSGLRSAAPLPRSPAPKSGRQPSRCPPALVLAALPLPAVPRSRPARFSSPALPFPDLHPCSATSWALCSLLAGGAPDPCRPSACCRASGMGYGGRGRSKLKVRDSGLRLFPPFLTDLRALPPRRPPSRRPSLPHASAAPRGDGAVSAPLPPEGTVTPLRQPQPRSPARM